MTKTVKKCLKFPQICSNHHHKTNIFLTFACVGPVKLLHAGPQGQLSSHQLARRASGTFWCMFTPETHRIGKNKCDLNTMGLWNTFYVTQTLKMHLEKNLTLKFEGIKRFVKILKRKICVYTCMNY